MTTGDRIRDYVLLDKIGEGATGEVWKAEHAPTRSVYAIKFLNNNVVLPGVLELRRMRHPNIVRILYAFEENGMNCLVREYVDGESLGQRLNWLLPELMPLEEVFRISKDVLAALEYAHTLPAGAVVHRNVKPSNILLDQAGRALLTDVGIAFGREASPLGGARAGAVSPAYASPEPIQQSVYAARSDIYSFGSVLYEMLAGRPPFPMKAVSVIEPTLEGEMPTPIKRWNHEVPFDFEWITYKALNHDPAKRFASCAEMAHELTKAFEKQTGTASPRQAEIEAL
jgi:serine/threonine-protein kinase